MGNQASDLVVGPIRAVSRDGAHCLSADLDDEPLWFSTADVELTPAPEAFATAALIPAAATRRRLRMVAPLDPLWRANVARALDLVRDWWGYAGAPLAPPPADEGPGPAASMRDGTSHTALFFSGGVDSFHVLLRAGLPIDTLVMVQGFDFDLDDHRRAAAAQRSLRAVAGRVGAKPVFVRTNIKTHPTLSRLSWDRTHGSAMAAVAHLLGGQVDRVVIAPGLPGDRNVPWGSHPQLDPLWSSSRVSIVHGPPGLRIERLRAIAAEPLVRDHLRVCWKNATPEGNCGACPKCVVAMVMLEEIGQLGHSRVFGDTSDLVARVDALRRTVDRYETLQEILDGGRLSGDLERAVRDLVHRSRIDRSWPVQFRRRVAGRVLGLFGISRET